MVMDVEVFIELCTLVWDFSSTRDRDDSVLCLDWRCHLTVLADISSVELSSERRIEVLAACGIVGSVEAWFTVVNEGVQAVLEVVVALSSHYLLVLQRHFVYRSVAVGAEMIIEAREVRVPF